MTAAAELARDRIPVAIPGAATPAEIAGCKSHACRCGATTHWVEIITAPHTRAVT